MDIPSIGIPHILDETRPDLTPLTQDSPTTAEIPRIAARIGLVLSSIPI